MYLLNPNFVLSEKSRELARKVTVLGVSVAVFRVYTVPVETIPLLKVPTEWVPKIEGTPVLGLSTIAAIATVYYFILYFGQYLSERSTFNEAHINAAFDELEAETKLKQTSQSINEQIGASLRRKEYAIHAYLVLVGGFARAITDCVVPILLTATVLYAEGNNIISLTKVLMYSAFDTT